MNNNHPPPPPQWMQGPHGNVNHNWDNAFANCNDNFNMISSFGNDGYRAISYGNIIDGHQTFQNSKNNNEQMTSIAEKNVDSNIAANNANNKMEEKVVMIVKILKKVEKSQIMLWCLHLQPIMIYP